MTHNSPEIDEVCMIEARKEPELYRNLQAAQSANTPYVLIGGYHAENWMFCSNSPHGDWAYLFPSMEEIAKEPVRRKVYTGSAKDFHQVTQCSTTGTGNSGKEIVEECVKHLTHAGFKFVAWYPYNATVPVLSTDSCVLCLGVRASTWLQSWHDIYKTDISFVTDPNLRYFYVKIGSQHHLVSPYVFSFGLVEGSIDFVIRTDTLMLAPFSSFVIKTSDNEKELITNIPSAYNAGGRTSKPKLPRCTSKAHVIIGNRGRNLIVTAPFQGESMLHPCLHAVIDVDEYFRRLSLHPEVHDERMTTVRFIMSVITGLIGEIVKFVVSGLNVANILIDSLIYAMVLLKCKNHLLSSVLTLLISYYLGISLVN